MQRTCWFQCPAVLLMLPAPCCQSHRIMQPVRHIPKRWPSYLAVRGYCWSSRLGCCLARQQHGNRSSGGLTGSGLTARSRSCSRARHGACIRRRLQPCIASDLHCESRGCLLLQSDAHRLLCCWTPCFPHCQRPHMPKSWPSAERRCKHHVRATSSSAAAGCSLEPIRWAARGVL